MPRASTLTAAAAALLVLASGAALLHDALVGPILPASAPAMAGGAPQTPRYVLVLMLGQAASKSNFEAYGYPYRTTPGVMRLGKRIVWLRDAVSTHSAAGAAIQHLFHRETKGFGGLSSAQSLFDRLGKAGVGTAWYSSQWTPGPGEPVAPALAASARVQRYFSGDDAMIEELIRHLRSPMAPSFLVGQLPTALGEGCPDLPPLAKRELSDTARGKNFFGNFHGSEREVACQDAAVSHVDRLLSSVIEAADGADAPVIIVYAADRGADPYGAGGHHTAAQSSRRVEIPVAFFANEAARRVDPAKWEALAANAGKPFLGSWLHETILDLYDLAAHYGVQGHLSLFSSRYSPEQRAVFMQAAPLAYDGFRDFDRKDYLNRTRINLSSWQSGRSKRPTHVFAHRMDSELALLEAVQYFSGFELDIVFDPVQGRFNVHHPPALETGFTLERALRIVSRAQDPVLWLDWKNPAGENFDRALQELARVATHSGLVERIIVETEPNFVDVRARRIRDFGFRHSYYMPTDIMNRCSAESTEGCAKEHQHLAGIVRQMGPDCLSFDARGLRFAARLAADTNTRCILAWDLGIDSARQDFLSRVSQYANVDGLIVRFPTKFFY